MAVVTDYTGRFVDLLIFEGVKPADEQRIRLGLSGNDGGKIVAGIQKLVQSYALLFLTERGSIGVNPTQGAEFIAGMRQSRIQDEADVLSEFTLANELVRQQLALTANAQDLPDDETFDSATLENFSLDHESSTIRLSVKVISLAGTSRDIILPVPIAIR
jgi:hypothetical protein